MPGRGGLPPWTSLPCWGVLWGPHPSAGRPQAWRKTTQPLLSSQNSPLEPYSSLRRPGPPGARTKGPSSHLSLTSHRHQPAGRAHGDLSSRLWRGQACGTPVGRGPAPLSHDSADRPHREPRSPSPETLLVKPSLESFSLQARCGCHTCRPWSVHSATVTQITRHP